ncbi:RlpA-like double-psi beta-barrel-protein domain-containing protein-containing protein [Xylaria intraflava]|nr:RlpA-like double-psi beta-barrel-protein domain-containing protein-containing protein [Xylaria intraflava]
MSAKSMIIAAVAAFASTVVAKSGDMTYYAPGLGACGIVSDDGQPVVALNSADYAGGANCGRWISINANGQKVAAQVVDLCPGCGAGGLDVSSTVFGFIAPLSEGRVNVDWTFE